MSVENLSPYGEQLKDTYNPTRLIVTGAALSAVALAAITETAMTTRDLRKLKTDADMVHLPSNVDQSIYILPGCRSDGRFIANAMGGQLSCRGSVHGVVYPQRGFPVEQIKERLLETRQRDADRPASFYAMSMGGMVLSHLLADEEFRSEFGPVDKVIFDSSPAGARDLMPSTHSAMTAAALMPHSFSMARLYRQVVSHRAQHTEAEAEDSEAFREHALSTAATPLPAVVAQTRFIRRRHFAVGELASAREAIGSLAYISSAQDDVVDVYSAVDNFSDIYGERIPHIIDSLRANPSHAAGVEYTDLVCNLFSKDRDPIPEEYEQVRLLSSAA